MLLINSLTTQGNQHVVNFGEIFGEIRETIFKNSLNLEQQGKAEISSALKALAEAILKSNEIEQTAKEDHLKILVFSLNRLLTHP
ncbi:hypothetical protein QNI19_35305 [Cytophagaceae bacterium DM2B3-1]|uniref:Uncharacterized protein n=1 Tax=Xanthocytophaga flava TaxID=3048013 RepID=A0ABT7CWZ5_9BACT|nr:hypothetical protein [Xanthocytophaga flavus]MDJ1498257.1 hypothetical protein [Xanthocytophaga flavus]